MDKTEVKQVEELARALCNFSANTICPDCADDCFFKEYARRAVAKGWCRQSEWISVEERLPECERGAESKAVLFITKQGFMYTGYYGCGGIFHDRYFREFKNATEGYDISNVTHWMPLPEPPKSGAKMKGGAE